MVQNEPSLQDLQCLTFSLSTLYINYFPVDSLLKKQHQKTKADNKCSLKFGAESVKCCVEAVTSLHILHNSVVYIFCGKMISFEAQTRFMPSASRKRPA